MDKAKNYLSRICGIFFMFVVLRMFFNAALGVILSVIGRVLAGIILPEAALAIYTKYDIAVTFLLASIIILLTVVGSKPWKKDETEEEMLVSPRISTRSRKVSV